MQEPIDVAERMRREWNERAEEDAHFYVAFGRREQADDEFFETAREVVLGLEMELRRLPANANRRAWRALEIGCGPGRLMRPMSRHFGEIHGVDVSDEMIAPGSGESARHPACASACDQRLRSDRNSRMTPLILCTPMLCFNTFPAAMW